MSLTTVLRFIFSFRLLAAVLITWVLFSTQSMAWQRVNYNPYPTYAAAVNFNPYVQPYRYPAFYYPQNYYPQPGYYKPQLPTPKPVTPARQPEINNAAEDKPVEKPIAKSSSEFKQAFIDKLLPYIERENTRLKKLRERALNIIQRLNADGAISERSKTWLKKLARKYRIRANPLKNQQAREELLTKVDIIPPSLTLAQAANESAWGKSRFAIEANNLFGIWTYDESKGLKPQKRDPEKKHLVRVFDHYGESVSYYMHTLNSHPAYKKLREIRRQQRYKQLAINGYEMANGLEKYSAKGYLYIKLIRKLIQQNQWAQLDTIKQSV